MVPVGRLPYWVLPKLGAVLPESFGGKLKPVALPPLEVPQQAYRKSRGQYEASSFLREVLKQCEGRVLALTGVDLYAPGLNFVFGLAECPGRGALVSVCRLDPRFYRERGGGNLLQERLVKEAVHELGHTLGLGHCARRSCVMSFSNSILEVDAKGRAFCRECSGRLERVLPEPSRDSSRPESF
ncbi:MAG: archaemetzincin family Zn-dependent metalloprotease [Candidatus Hadarchaeales archaeon]